MRFQSDKKNEAIEILGTIVMKPLPPKEKRKKAVVRKLMEALPTSIQTAAS